MKSLAEQVFSLNPGVQTEDAVLNLAFDCMRAQQGTKSARYYFWYDEDFAADFVSEYRWLQRNSKENQPHLTLAALTPAS